MARGQKITVQAAHPQAQFTQDVLLPGGGVLTEHVHAVSVVADPPDPEREGKRLKGAYLAMPDGSYAPAPKEARVGQQWPVPMEVTDTPAVRAALMQRHPTTGRPSHLVLAESRQNAVSASAGEAPAPPEPETPEGEEPATPEGEEPATPEGEEPED